MTLRASSRSGAERAEVVALAAIDRQNLILRAWKPESEFSRWSATRGVASKVSPELFDVLALFDHWRSQMDGALDPSAEAAVRLWQRSATLQREPTRVGPDNSLERLTERGVGLVTDQPL
jgi:thiamine biosynthesis lipoprotein